MTQLHDVQVTSGLSVKMTNYIDTVLISENDIQTAKIWYECSE